MYGMGFEPMKYKHGILRPAPLTTRETIQSYCLINNTLIDFYLLFLFFL